MAKKWCYANLTPFLAAPNGAKLFDLPQGALVEPTGQQQQTPVNAHSATWSEVQHSGVDGIVKTGWVNDAWLDEYIEQFPDPEVHIPNPTPEPNDAPQYMLIEGRKKFNMCGELCIAFVVGEDIDSLLAKWRAAAPSFYNSILAGDRDKPTGAEDLRSILTAYGYAADNGNLVSFRAGLTDPLIGFQPTQGRVGALLQTHFLVAMVTINGHGKLITKNDDTSTKKGKNKPVVDKGTLHWVVVDKVMSNGMNAGRVELYNPFPNRRQEYSFNEFIKSCNSPSWPGWWVKRGVSN